MIKIRRAEGGDLKAIIQILQEMDEYYGEQAIEPSGVKAAQITASLLGKNNSAYGLVAYDEVEIAGFCSYSFLWPAVLSTKSLYLKELYVSQSHRRHGIGVMLMQHIFAIAKQNNCSRVEWTTDRDNKEAQQFYERLGFTPLPSKLFYRAGENPE